ncbi:MAG: O-antigen ligase family protein [Patescibacteria group bacterium]|jgi:hypothetical protein
MIYLIITFIILFSYLAVRRLDWALYLVLMCLPAYGIRFQVGFLPWTLLEVMILVLFLAWFLKTWKSKDWPKSSFFWPAAVVLVIATVSMFVAPDLRRAAGLWKAYFVEPLLLFAVLVSLVKSEKEIRRVILALGAPALLIAGFAIIQKITGGLWVPEKYWLLGEGQRVTSFYSYPNAIGLFITPIVMLYIGYLKTLKHENIKTLKPVLVDLVYPSLVIITGILAIIFAKSDGAMVGLVAGLVVFGLLAGKKSRWAMGITIIFVICYLLFAGLPVGLWQNLSFQDWSGQVRLSMWGETWQMLKDHWFLGAGLGGYQTALIPYHQAKYLEIFLYPHNFVLNFWVDLGLAGLLTFVYIIGKFFRLGAEALKHQNIKTPLRSASAGQVLKLKPLVVGLIAVMVVILVHGLVDVPYFKNDLAALWWVVVGLMSSIGYEKM